MPPMVEDLSRHPKPIGSFLSSPASAREWDRYRLSDEQVAFFHEYGYLKGVRILSDDQVEVLRADLEGLFDPRRPGHDLFHEYHSNESADPTRVLFHALGAWRITP